MKNKFCTDCGTQLNKGEEFCPKCMGDELSDENEELKNNIKRNETISKDSNDEIIKGESNNMKYVFRIIFNAVRYAFGGIIVIESLLSVSYSRTYTIIGILSGLSYLPFVYRTLLFKFIKSKRLLIAFQIILPTVLSITWVSLISDIERNSSVSNSSEIIKKTEINNKNIETTEEKIAKFIKEKLVNNASIDNYVLNSKTNKYDFKIKYTKPDLSSYECASDTQYFAKQIKIFGDGNIGSIQYECINSSGTFFYVLVENVETLSDDKLDSNTKYYDNNYNLVKTNIKTLEENVVEEYKDSSDIYSYKEVLRYPSKYKGKKAYWFGKIVQVLSKSSNRSEFRISVTCEKNLYSDNYYCDDTIYVIYSGEESFIEDDMVEMWGTMSQTETYTTVLGASLTIPKFTAKYMKLQ